MLIRYCLQQCCGSGSGFGPPGSESVIIDTDPYIIKQN
jgi:hypothetical protein